MCMGELPLIKLQEVFAPARPTNLIQTIQRSGYLSILPNKVINMTREEIENNYMFRVTKRVLKKEYPFILDMKLTDNWDDYKSLYFVELYIDPNKLMETLNIPPTQSNMKYINAWGGAPYITMLFPSRLNVNDVINNLGKSVENTIKRVDSSNAIPDDMKLPRPIAVSQWRPVRQSDNT